MNSVAAEDRVFAVERALMLLQCFERADEARTLASLAKQSGLYKSTILRLANSMCKMGFLARQASGLFTLGSELKRLASLGQGSVDIARCVCSELQKLAAHTEEGASFHIRRGRYRICLFHQAAPADELKSADEPVRSPLDNGAAGQVLRAYAKCAKDPDLALVRKRGWAVSRGDDDTGLAAIAVPVFNRDKELLGALTLTTSSRHFTAHTERSLRQAAAKAAQVLTSRLRFAQPKDLDGHLTCGRIGAGRDRSTAEAQTQCA